ncbi:MAG: MarR family winged helix-turn-helix transcriptional regulator [Shinella sp.]|jgi:DNA-binding MarR family transcriptional regulator|nr:MarR family winged helix-turn-helix transcriptional regulator [Shinella sp.]
MVRAGGPKTMWIPDATEAYAERSDIDVTAVAGSIGYRVRRAQIVLAQRFAVRFCAFDLRPSEFCALLLISENPGRKQSEIAAALAIRRANFVTVINVLERRGLAERRDAAGDRRSTALHLTARGEKLLAAARQVQAGFETECLEKLGGPQARDAFLAGLARLTF